MRCITTKTSGVHPTTSIDGMAVNDNADLDREADVVGARAASFG